MVIKWIVIKLRRSSTDPHNVYNRSFRIVSKLSWEVAFHVRINTELGLPVVDFLEDGKWPGRLKARYLLHFRESSFSPNFPFNSKLDCLIVVDISFQMEEITKDSASGLMTLHTLKNKKDKVALSGYDCVILAIGRVPNTDTLSLDGLVSGKTYK